MSAPLLLPRSRARFEGTQPAPTAARSLTMAEDDADYKLFYKHRHAFECVEWSCDGEICFFGGYAPVGYEHLNSIPDGILDDRAFSRGFFQAPFVFAMDPLGSIRASGLPPDITLRELSSRLQAAVAARKAEDGVWKEDGSLNLEDEEAVHWGQHWLDTVGESVGWFAPVDELHFGDAYWLARPYVEGHNIKRGTAAGGGFVYVDSWGS